MSVFFDADVWEGLNTLSAGSDSSNANRVSVYIGHSSNSGSVGFSRTSSNEVLIGGDGFRASSMFAVKIWGL